jgi:Helix-turn-helix domain
MDVDPVKSEFLGVRETARRLGVHENTVRNWARSGILATARIPGSHSHRFDARDVERLRQQRGAAVSSVEQERRTVGPELVNATQLSQWAATRDAQDTFPELVRRLLASTPGITNLSVRSGDGVSAPGWDGEAVSEGTAPYLPRGRLCFELGVGGKPNAKADSDYEKRRNDPAGVNPEESVFVFVTPRRWSGAADWVAARRAESLFADVRVLDADDLEGWLQATPAVHYWVSEQLGRRPRDAETLEHWWARFQARTAPPLPARLFLAGRNRNRDQLAEFLSGPPGVVVVQAGWRDEAIAFVCATLEIIGKERGGLGQPPVVVASAEVWDRLVRQPGQMTLLPVFEDPDLRTAGEQGHHVVVPVGRDHAVRGDRIELKPPHRRGAAEALEMSGFPIDRADGLAALARRSMPALVRELARDPQFAHPPWSKGADAGVLAPLILAGGWTSSEQDMALVSRLAGESRQMIEKTLLQLRSTDDPPFIRTDTQWQVASPEEAFLVLHEALTPIDLERWHQAVVEVLSEPDPALRLAAEDRVLVEVEGVARSYSSVLRRGLAEGLVLVASIGSGRLSDGMTGADHGRRAVREILANAERDPTGSVWSSLTDVLPLLAEAAPEEFLDSVHDDLDRDVPLLAVMFQDDDESSWLFSSSPHSGLLWALEVLCWNADFLGEASRALARLHDIDPGGRLSNRPLESLKSVLVGWIRHTSAPFKSKMRAIERICRQMPTVGWELLLGLWPSDDEMLTPPASPRFQDWKPDNHSVPVSEWLEYISQLVRMAMQLADQDPQRWTQLIEYVGRLPKRERDQLLDVLGLVADPDMLNPADRLSMWERLRNQIAEHERFSDAEWVMDSDALARLKATAERLEPTTDVRRYAYLFDWRPDLPDVDTDDLKGYDEKLHELRARALEETIDSDDPSALENLARRSPAPTQFGWLLGEVAPDVVTPQLLSWLDAPSHKLHEAAASWAQRTLRDRGVERLRELLKHPEAAQPARRTAIARNAPASAEIWNALEEIGPELADAYWEAAVLWHISPDDIQRATRELLDRRHAWRAVDVLALHAKRKGVGSRTLTPQLVRDVLEAAIAHVPPNTQAPLLGYELGSLIDYLEEEAVAIEQLARYEFAFFRLLGSQRRPRALFEALGSDPAHFVDLVSRVYRGKDEPRRQLNEDEQAKAQHAWWVLHQWHRLPGLREDGTVDRDDLDRWVRQARLAFADIGRADIGDEQIGQVLAASPTGTDGMWPAEPIRDLIETIGSQSIEVGLHVGKVNLWGVTWRDPYEGGKQEHVLADRYREWAKLTASDWPRTSRLLRGLAEDFERQAQREDARAEITSDSE